MTTTVVNIYKHPYDQYIGRAGKGQDGYFGNPIRIGQKCQECGGIHTKSGDTLYCYYNYLLQRLKSDQEFAERFQELKDKALGCFCVQQPCTSLSGPKPWICHGQVMAWKLDLVDNVFKAMLEYVEQPILTNEDMTRIFQPEIKKE